MVIGERIAEKKLDPDRLTRAWWSSRRERSAKRRLENTLPTRGLASVHVRLPRYLALCLVGTPGLRLNVSRAGDYRTVETCIPGCPSGVNYQVSLTAEAEPTNFASRLVEALGSDVTEYAAR